MDRQQQILTWTSAFLLGVSLQRWFRQWREGLKDRFNSVLGRAALWTAGMRAIESLETADALFSDDMAPDLAGRRMCKKALQLAESVPIDSGLAEKTRLYAYSEVALTTWWFDQQILTVLTLNSVSSARGWLSARLRNSARGLAGPPRQVVVVGSGFDTRPWRLALPPMTKWLEVDSDDVVRAKKRGLASCRAETQIHSNTGYYPLRAVQWDIHAADITRGDIDWVKILDMYGFDLDSPIVWVVENVLMYLSQDHVKDLLLGLSEASCSGSVLLGNSTVNRNAELLSGQGYSTAYPAHLVEHWASSLPENPEVALNECKWDVTDSCTQYDIADQVCDGHASSLCAFDIPSSDMQEDFPTDVCFLARKL